MKTTIKLFLFVSIILIHTACDDFLDTQSQSTFTEEVTFSNLDFAEKAVLGIYYNFGETNMYGYSVSAFFPMDNDIEHVTGADDANGRKTICRYGATSGNSVILKPWTLLYQSIERANICIDNIPASPIWNGEYAAEAHRLYGEAKALRAWCYYELIRNWGDVPFSIHSVQSGDNYYLPKTDRDEIYEFLIEDLKDAQEYLPWLKETGTTERVNKAFVKGLRARLALAYSGYSLRTLPDGTFETRRGRNWQNGYYKIARDECWEVMQSGKHKLNPDFENIFRTIHAYKMDIENGEVLYEIALGRLYSGRIAEVIGMTHITNPLDTKYGRAIGEVNTNPYYFYSFDKTDHRRNMTVELYGYGDANALGMQRLCSVAALKIAKWRRSWITPAMGGEELSSIFLTGVNWPLMRYSDVILMFAEAENELNGPTDDAKDALKLVRQRAFSPDLQAEKVNEYVASISNNKDDFFEAIVNERAWELGGEGIRKYDLIRWNLLGEKINHAKAECSKIINDDPAWQDVPNNIFWKDTGDGETIEILNQDYRETRATVAGYTKTAYWSGWSTGNKTSFNLMLDRWASGYDAAKNNHLMPIHDDIIANSNGSLLNDQLP